MTMKLGMGASSRHRPRALISTSFETRRRKVAATSAATIPPKEWPTTAGDVEPEGVEQLVVVEDEVPQVVERPDAVGVARRRAGVLGGEHGEALGQAVEERVPLQPGGAVQEHDGIAGARRGGRGCVICPSHSAERLRGGPITAPAASWRSWRRLSGHQRFSHSDQLSRRCGSTSRANRSMFLSVSSWGIEPMCRSTIRLPDPQVLDGPLQLVTHGRRAPADHELVVDEVLERHVLEAGERLRGPGRRARPDAVLEAPEVLVPGRPR